MFICVIKYYLNCFEQCYKYLMGNQQYDFYALKYNSFTLWPSYSIRIFLPDEISFNYCSILSYLFQFHGFLVARSIQFLFLSQAYFYNTRTDILTVFYYNIDVYRKGNRGSKANYQFTRSMINNNISLINTLIIIIIIISTFYLQ